jgi:hypothetical protein
LKHNELNDTIKSKNEEIQKIDDDYQLLSIKYKEQNIEIKRLKSRHANLVHNNEIAVSRLSSRVLFTENEKSVYFMLFDNIAKLNISDEQLEEESLNKIGVQICSFLEMRDFKNLYDINITMRGFMTTNVEITKLTNSLYSTTNSKYKKKIVSMKSKLNSLETELSRKKKVMYLDYEDSKDEIKSYLGDFMVDDYEPGRYMKDAIDKS